MSGRNGRFSDVFYGVFSLFLTAGLFFSGYGVVAAQSTVENTSATSGDSVNVSKEDEVIVETVIRIDPPTSRNETNNNALAHDETNNDQTFSQQLWVVETNHVAGANFTLDWGEFVNQSDSTYTRPAKIVMGVDTDNSHNTTWDMASGVNGDTSATADRNDSSNEVLDAESTTPGGAKFSMDVTFVETGSGITAVDDKIAPSGDYKTTITGTLTAN